LGKARFGKLFRKKTPTARKRANSYERAGISSNSDAQFSGDFRFTNQDEE